MGIDKEIIMNSQKGFKILKEIRILKEEYTKLRYLSFPHVKYTKELNEDMKLHFIANSNFIEGNSLSYEDVKLLIVDGEVDLSKPAKEYIETINLSYAYDSIAETVEKGTLTNLKDIPKFHKKMTHGLLQSTNSGKYKGYDQLGADNFPEILHDISIEMEKLTYWYNKKYLRSPIPPEKLAIVLAISIAKLEPFSDKNEQLSRLLLNGLFQREGYPPLVMKNSHKPDYINKLNFAKESKDFTKIIEFFYEVMKSNLITNIELLKDFNK